MRDRVVIEIRIARERRLLRAWLELHGFLEVRVADQLPLRHGWRQNDGRGVGAGPHFLLHVPSADHPLQQFGSGLPGAERSDSKGGRESGSGDAESRYQPKKTHCRAGSLHAQSPGLVVLASAIRQPHLLYPQLRHVWQPSSSTSAWVLHLPHIAAPGGKAPADSSGGLACAAGAAYSPVSSPTIAPPISPTVLISEFFFALLRSKAARFSAISCFCASESSAPLSRQIAVRWVSMMLPSSATIDGMYTPPALQ